MDPKNWQALTNTIGKIGDEMKSSIQNDFSNIEKIQDPKEKEKMKDIRKRVQEAINNKDSKSASELVVELKDFLKHGS